MLLVALAALAADPLAVLPRLSYYFRDFTATFYPQRLFQARELVAGRWPWWNPYIEDGAFAMPTFYPADLLLAVWNGPAAASLLLTLHLPLAALAAFALARGLEAGSWGAFVAGSVFALGGFAGSTLSFWVFLQALAWAPLLVLTIRRAVVEGGKWVAWAALVLGLCLSTLAVEFVAQSVLLAAVLALAADARPRALGRLAAAVALGTGLAAVPIAVLLGLLGETVRGAGFTTDVALGNAIHPVTLLQVLVPGLFGSLASPVDHWWGGAYFSKGFPYFLSLYLGPIALALAAVGLPAVPRRIRVPLLATMLLALWYSLGRSGGLAPLLSALPVARVFRFPSKAFLIPHLGIALFAGFGADRLRRGDGWRLFAAVSATLGALLALLLVALAALQGAGIVPWEYPGVRHDVSMEVGARALVAFGACVAGLLASLRRIPSRAAILAVTSALVVDLARAGAGLNPQVDPGFFRALPEIAALRLSSLDGGRVFTYGLDYSPAFLGFLRSRTPGGGVWSFFVSRQMLAPYANLIDGVEVAEAKDLTSFVMPRARLRPEDYDPAAAGSILERLRGSAVSRVLSLDPLSHPDLLLLSRVPAGPPGLAIHVYELKATAPRASVACRVVGSGASLDPVRDVALAETVPAGCESGEARLGESRPNLRRYSVESRGAGVLVVRDTYSRGWSATVDGREASVLRANSRHMAVPVPTGRHEVVLSYAPPGLRPGLAAFAASLLVLAFLVSRSPPRGGG